MPVNPYPAGIGNPQQALQATAAMRNEPWYQQLVRGWGLNPAGDANGNVHLNDSQQYQLLNQARAHGIGISDSYQIDENGQIAQVPSHLLRNIGIGAGIAGLALTGFGAAGIGPLAGALGGEAAAGGGAALAGDAGDFFLTSPEILGGAGIGAGTAAGAAGGAAAGLTADSLLNSSRYDMGTPGYPSGAPTQTLEQAATTASQAAQATGKPMDWGQFFSNLFNKGASSAATTAGQKAGSSFFSDLATTTGDIEKARALGLISQAQAQQAQDRLNQQRAELALAAPGVEAKNSVIGDALANMQDVTVSGLSPQINVPTFSGGLRPSMLSANSRALGANMSRNALLNNMTGSDVPALTPLPTSNALDSILQGTSLTSGLLNAFTRPGSTTSTTTGGSDPNTAYQGTGTPGYPGDPTSPVNPMTPIPTPGGYHIDPVTGEMLPDTQPVSY